MVSEVMTPSRRSPWLPLRVVGTVVGTTVASATLIDGVWGRRHWPSSPDKLVGVDPLARELSITWSGIGSLDGRKQSQSAGSLLPGKAAYWEYSTDGTSVDALATLLDQKAPGAEIIHTNGHSLGGPVSFAVLCRVAQRRAARRAALQEQGDTESARAVRIPQLGRVVLNCSPFDSSDPRLSKPLRLLKGVRWPVGPLSKLAFSCIRSRLEGKPWGEAWTQAKDDALSGCAPALWLSQARMLQGIDLAANQAAIKPLVGPATEILYCRPEDPLLDTAVDTMQASDKYARLARALDIPFLDQPIPEVGHAENAPTFAYLARLGMQALPAC